MPLNGRIFVLKPAKDILQRLLCGAMHLWRYKIDVALNFPRMVSHEDEDGPKQLLQHPIAYPAAVVEAGFMESNVDCVDATVLTYPNSVNLGLPKKLTAILGSLKDGGVPPKSKVLPN